MCSKKTALGMLVVFKGANDSLQRLIYYVYIIIIIIIGMVFCLWKVSVSS
jgi:uncharacterized membrane protein YqjE